MALLDLPNEVLIHAIGLAKDDLEALFALCLAGNHRILSITRTFTLHSVELEWNGDDGGLQAKRTLGELASDSEYVRAVHSLRISFYGGHKHEDITSAVIADLKRLNCVTQITLSFFSYRASEEEWNGYETLLLLLGIFSQDLVSLTLEGLMCPKSWDSATEQENRPPPERIPNLPRLRHLSITLCPIDLAFLWPKVPALQVCELRAGDLRKFWSTQSERRQRFLLVNDLVANVNRFIGDVEQSYNEDLGRFLRLKRLCISSDNGMADMANLTRACRQFFSTNNAHAGLVELVLDVKFTSFNYRSFIEQRNPMASFPKLERMCVIGITGDLCDCFRPAFRSLRPISFIGFPALKELWLPAFYAACIDLKRHVDTSTLQPLLHLYFLDPGPGSFAYISRAIRLANDLPCLETVTWVGSISVIILRDGGVASAIITSENAERPHWTRVGLDRGRCCTS